MNLKRKKIIAKEFLLLTICIIVIVITKLSLISYNAFQNSALKKIQNERHIVETQSNELRGTYSVKIGNQELFFEEIYKGDVWHTKDWNYIELWVRLSSLKKSDSINYNWENTFSLRTKYNLKDRFGFKNGKDIDDFIDKNSLSEEELKNIIKTKSLQSDLITLDEKIEERREMIFGSVEQFDLVLLSFFSCAVILFPIRYLFYGIKWSFKTLKQSESTADNNV